MARTFGSYSPVVPLGTTWEETLVLEDADGMPIDITGYDVRAQLYGVQPTRVAGEPDPVPVLELTTPGFYLVAPAWPVFEGFSIPEGDDGRILLRLDAADTWTASPDNAKRKLLWDVRLVDGAGYTIPVVSGAVVFLPARTI